MNGLPYCGYARFETAFVGIVKLAGKEISKEEGANRLSPSSTNFIGRFGQLYLNAKAQSVCVGGSVESCCCSIITYGFG